MSDIFLQKFYNDVRDPSWPDIENYCDYIKLPDYIKHECQTKHNIFQRIQEIHSSAYHRNLMLYGYRFKNVVYIPVYKCAHTYYVDLFENIMGWEKILLKDIDLDAHVMFGLIMHPLTRFLKGSTQWIWESYFESESKELLVDNLVKEQFQQLIENALLGDKHTMPYSLEFGPVLNQVNWIPMDTLTDEEIKNSIQCFLDKHNCNITLPTTIERINKSSDNKLKLYRTLKSLWQNINTVDNSKSYNLYILYADDLKFFHKVLDNFNSTWQPQKQN